jgi:hypothetical protein
MLEDLAVALLDHNGSTWLRSQLGQQELHPSADHRGNQVVDRLALDNRRNVAAHLHRIVAAGQPLP